MIGNSWDEHLKLVWNSLGFKKFMNIINEEYKNKIIYPPKNYVFEALKRTPYEKVKVVIIGQDPYHGENQAHGLSFSVQKGVVLPPSLKNIYKELEADLNIKCPDNGDLSKWADEGVLLLNAVLTVVKDKPASHKNLGWERLTDYIISILNQKKDPVVFILWGNFAKEKQRLITNKRHLVIASAHPSPFSANYGFFGSRPFSKTNNFLISQGLEPVDWNLNC